MIVVKDVYEMSMLIDLYGQLLTSSQLKCLELHHNQDLSLAEIAEEMAISRQGVHDFIRRGRAALYEYEDKLGLLKKFMEVKKKLEAIQNDFSFIDKTTMDPENLSIINEIESKLTGIITKL